MPTQAIDLTSRRFAHLVVMARAPNLTTGAKPVTRWLVRCDCGNLKAVKAVALHCGDAKTCGYGCIYRVGVLAGQRFGRLIVMARAPHQNRKAHFTCRCDCGRTTVVDACNLKNGHTQSCGCWQDAGCAALGRASKTHGCSLTATGRPTPEYATWRSMLDRCRNKNNRFYKHYGGRGIRVCARWNSFPKFPSDMGHRPTGAQPRAWSLDRIDNNLGYGPDNCRWATPKQQANNRRKPVIAC